MKSMLIALAVTLVLAVAPAAAATPVFCNMIISTPGQYILTGDLDCGAFSLGVEVHANNVHINFNGHTLSGPGGDAFATTGIITANAGACNGVTGLHINGGTVAGFQVGIQLCAPASTTMNAHVNGMTVTGNSWVGIRLLNSDGNQVNGNTILGNRQGVRLENSSGNTVRGNIVNSNTAHGIVVLNDSNNNTIQSNTVNYNQLGHGIRVEAANNTIQGNTVNENQRNGIRVRGANNTIRGNTVNDNGRNGIILFPGAVDNTIQSNTAFDNGWDITPPVPTDLKDLNSDCDNNTWKSNTFGTSNKPCIQ